MQEKVNTDFLNFPLGEKLPFIQNSYFCNDSRGAELRENILHCLEWANLKEPDDNALSQMSVWMHCPWRQVYLWEPDTCAFCAIIK